MGKGMDKGT